MALRPGRQSFACRMTGVAATFRWPRTGGQEFVVAAFRGGRLWFLGLSFFASRFRSGREEPQLRMKTTTQGGLLNRIRLTTLLLIITALLPISSHAQFPSAPGTGPGL